MVVDRANISLGSGKSVMASAARFVDTLAPEDRIGLFTMPPGGPRVDFTDDHRRVSGALGQVIGLRNELMANYNIGLVEALDFVRRDQRVIAEVIGRECANAPGDPACPQQVEYEGRLKGEEAYRRTRRSVDAFRSLVKDLRFIEGPKTLILVSEGLIFDSETQADFLQLARDAAQSRAVFHTLQLETPTMEASRRFTSPTQMRDAGVLSSGLETVASTTRGARFRVVGSGQSTFDRIERELAGYYLLGLEVLESDRDHKPHKIEVRVTNRKGLTIRSRAEFILPEDSEPPAPADRLTEALRSPFLATELPLKVATYNLNAPEPYQVRVLIAAELGESASLARAHVAFALMDENGNVEASRSGTYTLSERSGGVNFKIATQAVVPPGQYRLKLAATDDEGRVASVEHLVEAELSDYEDMVLSDLVISGRADGSSVTPLIGDLESGDMLHAFVEIGTSDAELLGDAEMTLEVARASDAPILTSAPMSVGKDDDDRWIAEGRVALGRLPSGDYVARARLSRSGNRVTTISRGFRFSRGIETVSGPIREYLETVDHYKSGGYTTARQVLSEMDPDDLSEAVDTFLELKPTESQLKAAALAHTEVFLRTDSWEEAHLNTARALSSQIEDRTRRRVFERQWFLMVGHHFHTLNRDSEATFIFDAALDWFPDDAEILLAAGAVHEARAWMWGNLDSLKKAEKHYLHLLEIEPQNATAHLRMGHLLKLEKDWKKASAELQWTLEHSNVPEEHLVANLLLGDIHRARDNLESAIECYRAALDTESDCRAAATSLSHALHQAGEYAGARAVLEDFFGRAETRSSRYDSWWRYLRGDRLLVRTMMTQMRKGLR
jgi:VWFA-related protein